MPFKSKKQMRWMYANHPEMAKRWSKHTKDIKKLPEEVEESDKKTEKEATARLEALLFGSTYKISAVNQLAVQQIGKPGLPKLNQTPQTKPLVMTNQYGSGLQQTVKETASVLTPQAKPQIKVSFLRKLAEGAPAALPQAVALPETKPVAEPIPAAPAPAPQGIGRSKWTKGVSTGQGNFKLPSYVSGRIHTETPEDYNKATAIWNLRKFAPVEYKGKLQGTSKDAITSQDIANLHAHHQQKFLDYLGTADPKYRQSFSKDAPHLFDVMSGKAGTPEQRTAAEAYLNDLDQRMIDIGKRDIAIAQAKADAHQADTTAGVIDEVDKGLKRIAGVGTRDLYNLQGYGPEVQGRTWGEFGSDLAGTGFNVLKSPAAMALPMGWAGRLAGVSKLPGAGYLVNTGRMGAKGLGHTALGLNALMQPERASSAFGGAAGSLFGDTTGEGVKAYSDLALTGGYGLKSLGSGIKNIFQGSTKGGLGNLALGGAMLGTAPSSLDSAPSISETIRGQRGPGYNMPVAISDKAQAIMSPGFDNALPVASDLSSQLSGIPSYAAAGQFNLGTIGSSPELAAVDSRMSSLASLPPEQQTAEIASINQTLINTTGASFDEYKAYKDSADKLTKIRQNYDTLKQTVKQDPQNDEAIDSFAKAEADFVTAQKDLAKSATPFLTKALDKRYENEIKPMEADIGNVTTRIQGVMEKIKTNQPLTAEDVAAVQQGKKYLSTAKDFAFEKARLAFMRDGNLASPGIDKIFAQGSEKGFNTLSNLFSGRAESLIDPSTGAPLMVKVTGQDGKVMNVPLTRNTNVLENVAKSEFDKQVSASLGVPLDSFKYPTKSNGPQPTNPITGQQTADQPWYQSAMNMASETWNTMSGTEKMLLVGGLGLGLVSMLSSLMGDDDEGSGLESLLGILGIGAVAAIPLMRYFGGTQASTPEPAANDNSMEAVKYRADKAKTNNQMKAIEQIAAKDPAKAAQMVAEMAKSDPKTMEKFKELDNYYKNNWKKSVPIVGDVDVTSDRISGASEGKLTPQQASMLKQNWPLVRKQLGFK